MQSAKALSALVVVLPMIVVGCGAEPVATTPTSSDDVIQEARLQVLQEFAEAWNRHDIDAIMSMMTPDCIFDASGGPDVTGARAEGQQAVRAAFEEVFEAYPDAQWNGARHFVDGERGVSEWTFRGTRIDGSRVEVNGCDLFTFHGEKIAVKNSYRKNRPPIPPKRQ